MNDEAKPILIEASKLSLKDDFLQYKPRDRNGKELKKLITKAIKNGIKDFEYTGSHEIFGFCDLINTEKIIEKDEDEQEEGFYCAGCALLYGDSLASICHEQEHVSDMELGGEVGWVVFDAA